jgi:hypothetical protein
VRLINDHPQANKLLKRLGRIIEMGRGGEGDEALRVALME